MNKRIRNKHMLSIDKHNIRVKLFKDIYYKCEIAGVEPNLHAIWSYTHDMIVRYSFDKLIKRIYLTEVLQPIYSVKHMLDYYERTSNNKPFSKFIENISKSRGLINPYMFTGSMISFKGIILLSRNNCK